MIEKIKLTKKIAWFLALVMVTGCNMPGAGSAAPTMNSTQAYQTVEARLTEAAPKVPSKTPRPSATSGDVTTATPASPTIAVTTAAPPHPSPTVLVKSCDQATPGNPLDVTIPDDTQMTPGQTFVKTWRLQNTGTCTWSTDYSIGIFSGDAMAAPSSVKLPKKVAPGESVDVSVEMTAPSQAATYQGNWKLRNASQTWFGIGPSGASPFWVRIVVTENGATVTPGPTPTGAKSTAGASPTSPSSIVNGTINLVPNDQVDLDTGNINSGGGADMAYYANNKGRLFLSHAGGGSLGLFGKHAPSLAECQSTSIGGTQVPLDTLNQGQYLCYRTDQGLYGWMRLLGFNDKTNTLTLQISTWANPYP